MNIYDIINTLESLIQENNDKVSLVLHRNMKANAIPVYKTFSYTLYLIHNKEKKIILQRESSVRCPSEKIEEAWEKEDLSFVFQILKWMNSETYKKLRDGIQQISDLDNGGRD